MKKKNSIARSYFKSVSLVVLSSMLLLATIFLTLVSQYFHNENLENLDAVLQSVREVMAAVEAAPDAQPEMAGMWETLRNKATDLASKLSGATLLVADADGHILYHTGDVQLLGDTLSAGVRQRLDEGAQPGGRLSLRRLSDLDGLLERHYYVAGSHGPAGQDGYVLALTDAGRFSGYLSDLLFAFFWASVLMLLVSGAMALATSQRISAPLTQISQAADRFGRGDFSARISVEKSGNDEVAQLAQNFNTMAANLETIDRSRQSFVGNIAHELRTPMTSIKGFVDGMLDGVIPPEQYPRYLGLVSEEVARLTRLIQSMLDISKLEAGEYQVNAKNYDIWETLGAVLMTNEQRLVDGRIGVGGYVPQRTLVYADSDLIYQVVYNIVDNAIKFTPPGGRIDLSVTTQRDRVYVGVRNTGEGVPADQLPHLFERFYKGDKSRGLHAGGAGLGMHISKVLVGVNGGSIRVDSDSASWTEFTFDLPQGRPELPAPRKERTVKNSLSKLRPRSLRGGQTHGGGQ